jgi:molybdopterin/thiamine biosynthesis adenylyltransferase
MKRKEVTHAQGQEAGWPGGAGDLDHEVGLTPLREAPLGPSDTAGPGRRLPRYPRLKPTIEVVRPGDGNLYLLHPSGEADLAIEGGGASEERLLALLDGTRAVGAVLASARGEADSLADSIAELAALGLVDDAADDLVLSARQRNRLDRQLRYLGDLAPPRASRARYQRRLADATVAVLGLGGLGSWTALALACIGLGRLVIVDGDVVEESNFNRQVLYEEADLGRSKAEAAAQRLRAFDGELEVVTIGRRLEGPGDVAHAIEGADLVVDAVDWPAHLIERWVDAACFEAGIPYLTMSHFPPIARVGPLYVPGLTSCFECLEAKLRPRYPLYDGTVAARTGRPSPTGTFGPACGLIGSWVAADVAHFLTGLAEPSTLGRARLVDLRSMEVEVDELPEARCARCAR